MIGSILTQLTWAALTGSIAMAVALGAGRINFISPNVKVWICRAAFMKLVLSLIPISWLTLSAHFAPNSGTGHYTLLPAYVTFLFLIWAMGVVVVIGTIIRSARQTNLLVAGARLAPDQTRMAVQHIAQGICNRRIIVLQRDDLSFPYVVQLGRPILVLPTGFAVAQNRTSVAHEIAHIAHADLRWNLVYRLIAALFWFHPLVFKLEDEACLWQESAADVSACGTTASQIGAHARAILAASSVGLVCEPHFSSALAGSAATLARRLRALYVSRPSRAVATIIACLIAAASVPIGMGSQGSGSPARELAGTEATDLRLWSGPGPEIASLSAE